MQPANRLRAADRAALALAAPAHVDDRDVEVADVADEVERLVAGRRLVDDEAVFEGAANAQADEWVAVDDQAVWGLAQGCFPIDRLTFAGTGGLLASRGPILPSRRVR